MKAGTAPRKPMGVAVVDSRCALKAYAEEDGNPILRWKVASGKAFGAVLFGLVFSFSGAYLPVSASQYSIVLTFLLIVLVLAFRPQGLFGRPG